MMTINIGNIYVIDIMTIRQVKLAQSIRLLLSVREVASSSPVRSEALVKIECA